MDMNKINYDKQMQKQIELAKDGATLLLHVCCAPCLTYCLTRVIEQFDVTLFYSNSNITDANEWQKRLDELEKLVDLVNDGKYEIVPKYKLKLVVDGHNAEEFLSFATPLADQREGGNRCWECYKMRLANTHKQAMAGKFDYFASTLSVSPYKNATWLNQIGEDLAQSGNTKWLASDFKKNDGYRTSVALSNKYGLYRQHYCGCEFSKGEE